MRVPCAVLVVLGAVAGALAGAEESQGQGGNLVRNGGFEEASPAAPPPGWAMWGAEAYKVPANYNRDTTRPHSGQACLRIHHPAGTNGYLVTHPGNAIRPVRDRQLTVSFWTRADQAGQTSFWLVAYESIAPYVDAPSPGRFTLDVGPDWREHRFTLVEGWDFLADRSRYLMLAFTASVAENEARTLWVDDVQVSDGPSPREGRLADLRELAIEPLPHRLTPGADALRVTLCPARHLRATTREAAGISFHRVSGWTGHPYSRDGDAYTLPPATEEAIRNLRLPMTRFYALGAEAYRLERALDHAADVCRRTGIPEDRCVLEFETQGATEKLPPERWADGVRHSLRAEYGFRHWEIANEPYLERPGTAFPTPDDYVAHVREVSRAIRAVHPQGQIGIGIRWPDERWGNRVLKAAAGCYDFVAAHHYAHIRDVHSQAFEAIALGENYAILEECLALNALLRHYNPDRTVYQLDTEWGMHSRGPNGEKADYVARNGNIVGVLHRAVRLIYYARENILRGAASWQMLNRAEAPGFGILEPRRPEERFMLYWLYYHVNRHLGDRVIGIEGTAPWYAPPEDRRGQGGRPGPMTPILATIDSRRGDLCAIVANGSWTLEVPFEMRLDGFRPGAVEAFSLSDDDPDRHPLLAQEEGFRTPLPVTLAIDAVTGTLPPRSISFLRLYPTPQTR
ncbi:MAG: hypothetical protein JXR77_17695 [Lentisphaeria bacterium]|nr:hypothetical protein [Lentisphaeria bacterium]